MEVLGGEQQLCPCFKPCQEFQKLVELKDTGLVVYRHYPRTEDIIRAEAVESAVNRSEDVFILTNKKNVNISSYELTTELEKENISCPRCRKTFEYAQELLQEVKSIDRKLVMGICDHCRKKAQASKAKFCSCDKIVKKFISIEVMEKKEKKVRVDVSSSHLIKDFQEKLNLHAEREKKKEDEERQKKHEQAQMENLALEEKILHPEEKKRQAVKDQAKYEKEQRKLDKKQKKYEEAQKKLAEHKNDSEKNLESKLVVKEKKQDKPTRDKSKENDGEIISEPNVKGKIPKVSMIAKKHVMPKPDHRDKTEGVSEKKKMNVKVKLGDNGATEKGTKDLRSGIKQKDKINEVSEKAKTDLKAKLEQKYKGVPKEQKIKPENNVEYEKKLKKQLEKLRHEREARKPQVAIDKEQIDAPSKKGIASKPTRFASVEIEVSLSKIQKSLKKTTSEKQVKQGKGKESESKTLKKESSVPLIAAELQTIQAQHLTEKQEALKNKNYQEEAVHKAKGNELERRRTQKEKERSEANLKLFISKQAKKMGPSDVHPEVLSIHKCSHQQSAKSSPFCQLCLNSELEMEVISLEDKKNRTTEQKNLIIGEKIFKYNPRLEKIKELEGVPILFQKEFFVESDKKLKQTEQIIPLETKREQKQILSTKIDTGPGQPGVIRYALSDRTFIDKGWTMLPTEKIVRKMNVYRMHPAHPEFDWFEHNKNKRLMTYDTGERLAEFDDNGRGRWYYRNGRLALDYYDAEETNAQQRIVIYSSGEPDERGRTHPITILATFDYLGNGIVFDHAGKIRLKYNQTEGVVLDRGIGPVSHWQWHSLNDPPVLQQVMIDTQMSHKDPNILKLGSGSDETPRPDNEEMIAIEFDNFIKEKGKKLSQKFKPFQIRMKALKINEHFSLKILDQATVYLIFRDGSTNLKLNIGMILDHQEIVDVDTAEVGEVSNSLERFPARTDSLAGLQRSLGHAQHYERQRTERERWLRPPEPCASADHLIAAVSPPIRLPLRTIPTGSSFSTEYRCSRKPKNNLYYDTRLRC